MNSERFKCIMAVLGRYELTLLEKQFVGRVKEYCEKNGMITEQQGSILEEINRGKIRWMKKTSQGEEACTGKGSV
jgi:ERCC4-related helicase